MTITIFEDKNRKGKKQIVTGNIRDLKGKKADKPSSIRLTDDDEAVLLFKNDDWHGGALYIRGPKTVDDLGKASDGGRFGFGNSIRSVRVTPFQIDLNITVVRNEDNKLPGKWKTEKEARTDIRAMVDAANDFYTKKRALLKLDIARITFRTSKRLYAFSMLEQILLPPEWTERGELDVVFSHRFTKEGTIGRAMFPCFGQSVVVAKYVNANKGPDTELTTDQMAAVMVHEIGHHYGLSHNTSNDNSNNLMFPELVRPSLDSMLLNPDQIREMQDRLANNISRRGERN